MVAVSGELWVFCLGALRHGDLVDLIAAGLLLQHVWCI